MFFRIFHRHFLCAAFFIVGCGFLLSAEEARAANTDIIINEIGAYEPSDHEWIEIYNKGADPIDVTGWKFFEDGVNHGLALFQGVDMTIEAGEYAIIADVAANFVADYPAFVGTVIDSSWSALNESGEMIELRISSDPASAVESFTYITAENFSLERLDPILADYTSANWREHVSGNTAGAQNSSVGAPPPPPDTTAPTDVTDLTATAGDGSATLSWTASVSEDVSGYKIYVDDGTGFGAGTDAGNVLTYAVNGLANGTLHIFKIIAYDATGNESAGTTAQATPEAPAEENPPANVGIFINEFVADPVSGETEWIELYNAGDAEQSLDGWKLEDGIGALKTFGTEDAINAKGFFVFEISGSKLNNDGDIILLKNTSGDIADQVAYGNWDDGNVSDNAPATEDPNAVARKTDGNDTDADAIDWASTATPTKNAANTIASTSEEETPPPQAPSSGGGAPAKIFQPSDLVVNEFVSDPADGEVEWVELFNNTSETVGLASWTLEDGGESVTVLSGNVLPRGFFVLEKPKGNLNNTGDALFLKYGDTIIDQVTYGDWDDGELSDNAPAAADPQSVARRTDGADTDNGFRDFTSAIPTKGVSNIISEMEKTAPNSSVIINEFLPNPTGADNETEFIELKNIGSSDVNIEGWLLGDASSARFTARKEKFSSTAIPPQGFLTLFRKTSKLALNNTGGDAVKLFDATGRLVEEIPYTGTAKEGYAYARDEKNHWSWTSSSTPNKENAIVRENAAPQAVIEAPSSALTGELLRFDASDSTDPDGDALAYRWDFGTGETSVEVSPLYFYNTPKTYEVTLTVTDSANHTSEARFFVEVSDEAGVGGDPEAAGIDEAAVVINEFIPNPRGSDDAEWIELWNRTGYPADISGWSLDDEEGGSRPYAIPDATILAPSGFLLLPKSETGIALNNDTDAVRLIDPRGNIFEEVNYDGGREGASYARNANGIWQWTDTSTPEDANLFANIPPSAPRANGNAGPAIEIPLENIRALEIGDRVKVRGVISAPPGLLGSQIFYLAGSGVQVYMYKKDFPELALGDTIEVTGELSQAGGEMRVKVAQKSDIVFTEHGEKPSPHEVGLEDIGEELEGHLVAVEGDVMEKRGTTIFLDDGGNEVKIYFNKNTGIAAIPKEGDRVRITGIVSETSSGYRILPRFNEDIEIMAPVVNEVRAGETNLEKTAKDQALIKYLSATTMALVVVMGGLIIQMRRKS